MGVQEIGSLREEEFRDGELTRCKVQQMGRSRDGELRRWGVHKMASSRDREFRRWGVHEMGIVADREIRYKCLTRAVFCVAKAQDTKDAAKQRLSGLY